MTYDILRTPGTLVDLRKMVDYAMQSNGWQPLGAPFRDTDERQWCQAMTGPTAIKTPEVRLHEPKRK